MLIQHLEVRHMLSVVTPQQADANGDGRVDSQDFVALAANFGKPGAKTKAQGDFNSDATVDTVDLCLLASVYGQSYPVPPIAGAWTQIFNDEFNGDPYAETNAQGNPIYTHTEFGQPTDDFGTYFDRSHVTTANGIATITATKGGPPGYQYTSGMLSTGGEQFNNPKIGFEFTYGYIEMRAKFPGEDAWPTFWMMPADGTGGENDIVDNGAGTLEPKTIHAGLSVNGSHLFHTTVADMTENFHTYGCDWQADHTTYYFDGQPWATYPGAVTKSSYFMISLQVDANGVWAEHTPNPAAFPAKMLVDYVKVFQKA